jgi:hypothetical protein
VEAHVSPTDLAKILASRPGEGASAAATRVRDAVLAAEDRGAALSALGEVANDRRLKPQLRVAALLGTAQAATIAALPVPAAAFDAVVDPVVIDSALQSQLAPALTSVLASAPHDTFFRETRRMIGRRLLVTGERGSHVTRLLLDAGDHEGAVRAAADDFMKTVLTRRKSPDKVTRSWATIALDWMLRHPESIFGPLAEELRRRDPQAPAFLAELIAGLDEQPAHLVAAARKILTGSRERN